MSPSENGPRKHLCVMRVGQPEVPGGSLETRRLIALIKRSGTSNQGGTKRPFAPADGPGHRGTQIWDLRGNGDCGFRSLAAALPHPSGKSEKEVLEKLPALVKTVRSKAHQ